MHTWFFLYDEKMASKQDNDPPPKQVGFNNFTFDQILLIQTLQVNNKDLCSSTSVPNLEIERSK